MRCEVETGCSVTVRAHGLGDVFCYFVLTLAVMASARITASGADAVWLSLRIHNTIDICDGAGKISAPFQLPMVKSRLAVEMVTVNPITTSISEATVIIRNVVLPNRGTIRNSIRNTTNTSSDSA